MLKSHVILVHSLTFTRLDHVTDPQGMIFLDQYEVSQRRSIFYCSPHHDTQKEHSFSERNPTTITKHPSIIFTYWCHRYDPQNPQNTHGSKKNTVKQETCQIFYDNLDIFCVCFHFTNSKFDKLRK